MFRNDFGWRSEAGALGVVQGAPVEPAAVALEHGSAAIVDLEGDTARSSYYRTGDGLNRGYQGAMHLGAMLRDLATQPRGDAWHEALQRKRREGAALSRAVEQVPLPCYVFTGAPSLLNHALPFDSKGSEVPLPCKWHALPCK